MMRDVLFYKDTKNPQGFPGDWPAQTAIADGRPAPWVEMTRQELEDHKALHQEAFDLWEAALPEPDTEPRPRIILRSQNGKRWRLVADNLGNPTLQEITP